MCFKSIEIELLVVEAEICNKLEK